MNSCTKLTTPRRRAVIRENNAISKNDADIIASAVLDKIQSPSKINKEIEEIAQEVSSVCKYDENKEALNAISIENIEEPTFIDKVMDLNMVGCPKCGRKFKKNGFFRHARICL